MKAKFTLTDVQAESILNTRLRSLRKIEEMQINKELAELDQQHTELSKILADPKHLKAVIKKEIKFIQHKFSQSTQLGKRRTDFNEVASVAQAMDISAFVEKEAITIICSKMGWIRSLRGHAHDASQIKYKEGDEEKFIIECYTIDKIIICSVLGKFFTILADNFSKGKGYGESIKLLIDLTNDEVLSIAVYKIGQKFLLASSSGKGFIVNADELLAQTKLGKQIMQLPNNNLCIACLPAVGDSVACLGENRKLLIFKLNEVPELKRGQGVILQKFKDAKLADVKLFNSAEGLSWVSSGKVKTEKDISTWLSSRGGVGKIPPIGFSKTNRFN